MKIDTTEYIVLRVGTGYEGRSDLQNRLNAVGADHKITRDRDRNVLSVMTWQFVAMNDSVMVFSREVPA